MISAVIVNYFNFKFLNPLIESLKKEFVEEIIVVDNSCDETERKNLESLKGAKVYFMEKNLGFGKGANYGFQKAKGDYILFCNPDLLFKEGSIFYLKEGLKDFDAVGPSFFWDGDCKIILPYPYPYSFSYEIFSNFSEKKERNLYFSFELKIFRATKPINLKILSGTCFLIRKEAFKGCGGFDEEFFLYFEENDFFERFLKKGLRAGYIPKSKVIHFFNFNKEEIHKFYFENSKKIFERKHYPLLFRYLLKIIRKFKRRGGKNLEIIDQNLNYFKEILISPKENFVPSAYTKEIKDKGELFERLKEIKFFDGYLGILEKDSILKSFHFKVK